MTLYRVIGRDTGIPSLNDSALAGAAFGATVDLTLTAGVEAELIDAGLIEFVFPNSQRVDAFVGTDTQRIQAALAELVALGGGALIFDRRAYNVTTNAGPLLSIPANVPIEIIGVGVSRISGQPGTIIQSVSTTTANSLLFVTGTGATAAQRGYVSARDITFHGGTQDAPVVRLYRCNEVLFDRVRIRGGHQQGIWASELWNSEFRSCYFSTCGFAGTSYPAVLLDSVVGLATSPTFTVHFTDCEWEGNPGTDLCLTGDRTVAASVCSDISVTNFKQERQIAAQSWPVFDVDYAERVTIGHGSISMSPADSTSKAILVTGDAATYPNAMVMVSDVAIMQRGTAADNLVDLVKGRLKMSDVSFDTAMALTTQRCVRIGSTNAVDAVDLANVSTLQTGQLVSDLRLQSNIPVWDPSKVTVKVPMDLVTAGIAATLIGTDVVGHGPFRDAQTDMVRGTVTLPADWLGHTAVRVRARIVINATTGNFRLKADYRGGPSTNSDHTASTGATGSATATASSPANRLLVADFALTLSTANRPGDEVTVSFSRLGSDGADTGTADAYLIGLTLVGERKT